jgi:hypothetical protein
MIITSGKLEVGDKLNTSTCFGINWYKITRTTKTLAMSKRESDGYEYKFKRAITGNMSHPTSQYNLTNYSVERCDKTIK